MTTFDGSTPPGSQQMELWSTPSAAASPARTSRRPARAPDWPGNAPACGARLPDWLASFDPASSSWKTSQLCLDGDLATFSETWPRSGMIVAGTASLPRLLGRRTGGTESGS